MTSLRFSFIFTYGLPFFLSRSLALTKQLRPSLYLPVAATTSNRVRTKIVELIGVKLQKSSELFAYIKKNAYLCTRFQKCSFSRLEQPLVAVHFNVLQQTAPPRNRLNPATTPPRYHLDLKSRFYKT